jgi:prepilin-type processing-associated H-X9-DG protein/prepilin-type N-terminal cleavage/methylation domain-containing protein
MENKKEFICNAFTLIELLVVISIIMLLVSMLLPALKRAKSYSRSVACINNLKQSGLAFASYSSDNNGYFPGSYVGKYYSAYIAPYLGSDASYPQQVKCPSWGEAYNVNPQISYTMSTIYKNSVEIPYNKHFKPGSWLNNKYSEIVHLYDARSKTTSKYYVNSQQRIYLDAESRHNNSFNALFYDGSAKSLKNDTTYMYEYWQVK